MKISKLVIKEFKGIPTYISWFVIYVTKPPMIKTRALSIITGLSGQGRKIVKHMFQILDIASFFDAATEFLTMLDKKFKITKDNEEITESEKKTKREKLIEKIAKEIWDNLGYSDLEYNDRIGCANEILELIEKEEKDNEK